MTVDILTAAQGGTCAAIKIECRVYTPDPYLDISMAIQDIRQEIKARPQSSLDLPLPLCRRLSLAFWWKHLLTILVTVSLVQLSPPYTLCLASLLDQY